MTLLSSPLLLLLLSLLPSSLCAEVLVVVPGDEDGGGGAGVLELMDLQEERWRTLRKDGEPARPGPKYRAESLRPGTARLIEDHSVLQYELSSGSSLRLASYPTNVAGAAVLEYGDTLCLVGGYDTRRRKGRKGVLCWNPLTPRDDDVDTGKEEEEEEEEGENATGGGSSTTKGGWVALPDMSQARHLPGAVVMDGKLYVAGGYDPEAHRHLSSVEVFDDVTQKWYRVADMREERAALQLVSLRGRLYALGGRREREFLSSAEEYDPILDRWRRIRPMGAPRAKFGAVAVEGKRIYAVGGQSGFRPSSPEDNLASVEVFEAGSGQWRTLEAEMTSVRGPVRATVATQ